MKFFLDVLFFVIGLECFIFVQFLFFHIFMDMYDPSPFSSDWEKFKNLLGIGDEED